MKKIYLAVFLISVILAGYAPSISETAPISATATVVSPIGYKAEAGTRSLTDSLGYNEIIVMRPIGGSLIFEIETDGYLAEHMILASSGKLAGDSVLFHYNKIEYRADTVILTLIYSEN